MVAGLKRAASVDIGTNSVLLLVAERGADGRLSPVREEAEITRLGRGVDRTGVLSPDGMEATLAVLARFAAEARDAGAQRLVVTATSAARDARNGQEFLRAARERAGAEVEILSGDEEARLGYLAVASEFTDRSGEAGLLAIDVGGGSTEFVHGMGTTVRYRASLDIGSVRLTERCVQADPPSVAEQQAVQRTVVEALTALPAFPEAVTVVGVAGTVTSLFALAHSIEPYDAAQVHRQWLDREEVALVRGRLCSVALEERRRLPGIQPRRADVLPAGAILFETALHRLGARGAWVSDRGLRWGVLIDRWEALA